MQVVGWVWDWKGPAGGEAQACRVISKDERSVSRNRPRFPLQAIELVHLRICAWPPWVTL